MCPPPSAPSAPDGSFRERVLALVARIPPGRVMTYGQLALLAGQPGAARQAGYVMNSLVDRQGGLPWQRVVNAQGRLSTGKIGLGEVQRALLEAEDVQFDRRDRLDLGALQWWPPEAPPA